MSMSERPHVPAGTVGDLEIPANFEAVEALENEPQHHEEKE